MSQNISFFNFSLDKIISKNHSVLDAARVRLLYYGLIISFFALSVLFVNALVQEYTVLSITTGILLVVSAGLFKYFTYRPNWIIVSHIILIAGTLATSINVFLAIQTVNILTTGIMVLVISFSYYMLGQRAGVVYSLLNIVPVLTFLLLKHNNSYPLNGDPEGVDSATLIIGMATSFILIIFINSHIYTASIRTIDQLEAANIEKNAIAAEFSKVIKSAAKSSEAKVKFLSTMSHEIKTPLNAIIGMTNLMMISSPKPNQKENLEVLKLAANDLLSIVDEVLDLNKIELDNPLLDEAEIVALGNFEEVVPSECKERLRTARLLIAEDNPVNVVLMKKLLLRWGITPVIAENGKRAVELVQGDNFDIILMDLQMPIMNGFDAATEIRKMADPQKANIPIIALTASAFLDIRERVKDSGMNEYVAKPFNPDDLLQKIRHLLDIINLTDTQVVPL